MPRVLPAHAADQLSTQSHNTTVVTNILRPRARPIAILIKYDLFQIVLMPTLYYNNTLLNHVGVY